MFGRLFKRRQTVDFDAPLSAEADKFLESATQEFNAKQNSLQQKCRLDTYNRWGFDQSNGVLTLGFPNGGEIQAEGQILGSYSAEEGSWEWAWNNPHVEPAIARESRLVKQTGERLGISYLVAGKIPVSSEEFVAYLCAIGVKCTNSLGVFRGSAGPIAVLITLKNARWSKRGS